MHYPTACALEDAAAIPGAEELCLQHIFCQCGALQFLEGQAGALARLMHGAGEHVLAYTKLTFHQDGAVRIGYASH